MLADWRSVQTEQDETDDGNRRRWDGMYVLLFNLNHYEMTLINYALELEV
jgi:hypothetical protein